MATRGSRVKAGTRAACRYVPTESESSIRPKQIGELYRVRWQIELLFKRWKSHLGLAKPIRKKKESSSQIERYARLLGVVVAEWLGVACGGPLSLPLVPVVKTFRRWLSLLSEALRHGDGVAEVLDKILRYLDHFRPRTDDHSQRVKTRNRLDFAANSP